MDNSDEKRTYQNDSFSDLLEMKFHSNPLQITRSPLSPNKKSTSETKNLTFIAIPSAHMQLSNENVVDVDSFEIIDDAINISSNKHELQSKEKMQSQIAEWEGILPDVKFPANDNKSFDFNLVQHHGKCKYVEQNLEKIPKVTHPNDMFEQKRSSTAPTIHKTYSSNNANIYYPADTSRKNHDKINDKRIPSSLLLKLDLDSFPCSDPSVTDRCKSTSTPSSHSAFRPFCSHRSALFGVARQTTHQQRPSSELSYAFPAQKGDSINLLPLHKEEGLSIITTHITEQPLHLSEKGTKSPRRTKSSPSTPSTPLNLTPSQAERYRRWKRNRRSRQFRSNSSRGNEESDNTSRTHRLIQTENFVKLIEMPLLSNTNASKPQQAHSQQSLRSRSKSTSPLSLPLQSNAAFAEFSKTLPTAAQTLPSTLKNDELNELLGTLTARRMCLSPSSTSRSRKAFYSFKDTSHTQKNIPDSDKSHIQQKLENDFEKKKENKIEQAKENVEIEVLERDLPPKDKMERTPSLKRVNDKELTAKEAISTPKQQHKTLLDSTPLSSSQKSLYHPAVLSLSSLPAVTSSSLFSVSPPATPKFEPLQRGSSLKDVPPVNSISTPRRNAEHTIASSPSTMLSDLHCSPMPQSSSHQTSPLRVPTDLPSAKTSAEAVPVNKRHSPQRTFKKLTAIPLHPVAISHSSALPPVVTQSNRCAKLLHTNHFEAEESGSEAENCESSSCEGSISSHRNDSSDGVQSETDEENAHKNIHKDYHHSSNALGSRSPASVSKRRQAKVQEESGTAPDPHSLFSSFAPSPPLRKGYLFN
eukprot:MONOS_8199.1-p1 / transcript=MONOS_8199.1 / gene=MONOS_8199 / organism=Monocercomonoides_exilis_PA203 / gene_product=unspecified product / transcript_product=unspecified product / location=Mono_scaffold00302:57174-59606(+) / protein_length=811 / sequence_SO=supercontig / SO=protein_coding / is_pseudo=false